MRRFLVVGFLLTPLACSSPVEPEIRYMLGRIGVAPEVPATVEVGAPFTVSVQTSGNLCYEKGPTKVAVEGSTATITPWDRVRIGTCATAPVSLEHTASVRFDTEGPATVIVRGRRLEDAGFHEVTFERTVIVE